ncbi:hypothetical protein WCE34_06755 [Luteimonas sp. MJ204]
MRSGTMYYDACSRQEIVDDFASRGRNRRRYVTRKTAVRSGR